LTDPRQQRLFFALWPGEEVRARFHTLGRMLSDHRGRCTHPADLHATLVFLGNATRTQLPCLLGAAGAIRGERFTLVFDRVSHRRRSGILWCSASTLPLPLQQIHTELQKVCVGCGFPLETRRYIPHVTLARNVRAMEPPGEIEPIEWQVGGIALVRSNPAGPPPHYTVIQHWPLGG